MRAFHSRRAPVPARGTAKRWVAEPTLAHTHHAPRATHHAHAAHAPCHAPYTVPRFTTHHSLLAARHPSVALSAQRSTLSVRRSPLTTRYTQLSLEQEQAAAHALQRRRLHTEAEEKSPVLPGAQITDQIVAIADESFAGTRNAGTRIAGTRIAGARLARAAGESAVA